MSLDEWREQMTQSRVRSVGNPGVWIDRSPTGAGKSYADLAAFEIARSGILIVPTHDNCREAVAMLTESGIDSASFPKRETEGESRNCWNADADSAEKYGLSVSQAVCISCTAREQCKLTGYLGQVEQANAAKVVVATHARAIHASLETISKGREYVAIHEDCRDVLIPQAAISAGLLDAAGSVVAQLLYATEWRPYTDDTYTLSRDGETQTLTPTEVARRKKRRKFLRHLERVIKQLIEFVANAHEDGSELPATKIQKEPAGIQSLLLRASRDLKVNFSRQPVWRVLLDIATGSFDRTGVLLDGGAEVEREDSDSSTYAGPQRKTPHCDTTKSARAVGNNVARRCDC